MPTTPIALSGTPSGVVFDVTGGASIGLPDQTNVTSIPSFNGIPGVATITVTPKFGGCVGVPDTFNYTINNCFSIIQNKPLSDIYMIVPNDSINFDYSTNGVTWTNTSLLGGADFGFGMPVYLRNFVVSNGFQIELSIEDISSIDNFNFVNGNYLWLNLSNNTMTQSNVDNILMLFDQLPIVPPFPNPTFPIGAHFYQYRLNIAGGNASPSSLGLSYKNSAISKGATVITN